ncbi:hypothetical protein [Myceligenerans crystallogenes]|uniref:DUF4386 family protein n=1 Tax=Myceligenerans crystallogenes TaxID=316335 RepID=A0ABN2NHU3_9MICO
MADPRARRAGVLLISGALLANLAFAGLSVVFGYPDVLQRPPAGVLRDFAAQPVAIGGLFALLALGAGLIGPAAFDLARVAGPGRWSRWALGLGVAASAVQVAGLLRWPLLVPSLAAAASAPGATAAEVTAAADRFALLNLVAGQLVGESLGYVLTAGWTAATVLALGRALPAWSRVAGLACVPPILAGLLVPLGWEPADLVNFAGYILWSLWLLALGALLLAGRVGPGAVSGSRGRADN